MTTRLSKIAKMTSGLSIAAEGYPHARAVCRTSFRQKLLTPPRLTNRDRAPPLQRPLMKQYPEASRPQAKVISHALRRRHRASSNYSAYVPARNRARCNDSTRSRAQVALLAAQRGHRIDLGRTARRRVTGGDDRSEHH